MGNGNTLTRDSDIQSLLKIYYPEIDDNPTEGNIGEDPYLINGKDSENIADYGPVLTFSPLCLNEIVNKVTSNDITGNYELLIPVTPKKEDSLDVIEKVIPFIEDVINGRNDSNEWDENYFFDFDIEGNPNQDKWDNFCRMLLILIESGEMLEPLHKVFPTKEIQRWYIAGTILGYHKMFKPGYFTNCEEEIGRRENEAVEYGNLLDTHPIIVMEKVKTLCEKLLLNFKDGVNESIKRQIEKENGNKKRKERNVEIKALFDSGEETVESLAVKFDISKTWVRNILKNEYKNNNTPKRNNEIRLRHSSGESVKSLVSEFGLSRKRIEDIANNRQINGRKVKGSSDGIILKLRPEEYQLLSYFSERFKPFCHLYGEYSEV